MSSYVHLLGQKLKNKIKQKANYMSFKHDSRAAISVLKTNKIDKNFMIRFIKKPTLSQTWLVVGVLCVELGSAYF